MQICRPKNILTLLIFIFLLFNLIYLLKNFFYKNTLDVEVSEEIVPNLYLKKYVDFNSTAFENKGEIHFYYSSNKKFNGNFRESFSIKKEDYLCDFYIDKSENKFFDSNRNYCSENSFDFKLGCCKENNTIENKNCDKKIKCCSKFIECIDECLLDTSLEFNLCNAHCSLTILTKNYILPYCYYSKSSNETVIYSK